MELNLLELVRLEGGGILRLRIETGYRDVSHTYRGTTYMQKINACAPVRDDWKMRTRRDGMPFVSAVRMYHVNQLGHMMWFA